VTTPAQLRKAALALPETTEGKDFGSAFFSVRGRGFASLTKDGIVQLEVSPGDVDRFLADHPTGQPVHRNREECVGVRVPLADINGKTLNALVKAAWVNNAPKQLVVRLAAANDTNYVGDLPANLGKPALRALHTAGITSLEQAATWSESDLLQLHGVGPRAIRLLDEAFRKRGNPPG
jgi:hypothetical protein